MVDADGQELPGLVASSTWVVIARVVGAIGYGVSNAILARLLGPANFGYFALLSSVAVVAGFVASMGVNRSLLKHIALHTVHGDTEALAAKQRLALRILWVSLPIVGFATAFVLVDLIGFRGTPKLPLTIATTALVILSGVQLVIADALRAYGRRVAASFLEGRSGGAAVFVAFTLLLVPFVGRTIGLTSATALNVLAYGLVLPVRGPCCSAGGAR